MSDGEGKKLLISKWFPITEVSVESVRERTPGTPYPATSRLHVWFARKPLSTSRAAILGSLLPLETEKEYFLKLLGIPLGVDVRKAAETLERAKTEGKRLESNPLFWEKSFNHTPSITERSQLYSLLRGSWGVERPLVVDPMAGGGSIPFEAMRLGLPVVAGDLNPVSFIVLKGVLQYPAKFRQLLLPAVESFCKDVRDLAITSLMEFFPHEDGERIYAYLWVRTIRCPSCGLIVPLSPNWWVVKASTHKNSVAAKLIVKEKEDNCTFEIVNKPAIVGFNPNMGTVKGGRVECPRCRNVLSGEDVKCEAQNGRVGHQLYCVCSKKKGIGKKREEWNFRAPREKEIEAIEKANEKLKEKLPSWESINMVPQEEYVKGFSDRCSVYGVKKWSDLFSPRQLIAHLTYLEKFNEVKQRLFLKKEISDADREFLSAVLTYGAIVFDTCIDYNSLLGRWDSTRKKVTNSMSLQAFPFVWKYAEWDHSQMLWPWALSKVLDALIELVQLLPDDLTVPEVYNGPATRIPLNDKSVPCIVVDPPYAENVMYGEISDFFYVWLKRLLRDVFPETFSSSLTEKEEEAVSNPTRFRNSGKNARKLAQLDYETKMKAAFNEMNRVLQDDGFMTVMFTHRTAEAWSSLATALMESGFTFRSSWPVHTEPPQKFAKRDKGVLKFTVLLTCRKRKANHPGIWEHITEELAYVAKQKIEELSKLALNGTDLKVGVYAPVLGKFADYYPVKTATGKEIDPQRALDLVTDVLNERFLEEVGIQNADKETAAYINLLATFPTAETEYEEARLATVFGGLVTLDTLDIKGTYGIIEKDGKYIKILSARDRQAKGIINPYDPKTLKTTIDFVHAAILQYERGGLFQVRRLMQDKNLEVAGSPFPTVLQAYARYADNSSNEHFQKDAAIAKALLTALGKSIEFAHKKGERLDHYVSES